MSIPATLQVSCKIDGRFLIQFFVEHLVILQVSAKLVPSDLRYFATRPTLLHFGWNILR